MKKNKIKKQQNNNPLTFEEEMQNLQKEREKAEREYLYNLNQIKDYIGFYPTKESHMLDEDKMYKDILFEKKEEEILKKYGKPVNKTKTNSTNDKKADSFKEKPLTFEEEMQNLKLEKQEWEKNLRKSENLLKDDNCPIFKPRLQQWIEEDKKLYAQYVKKEEARILKKYGKSKEPEKNM